MRTPCVVPIGRREIKRLLSGEEFSRRLGEAVRVTWGSDHESGFCVARDIYANRVIFGRVVGFDAEHPSPRDPTGSISGVFSRSIWPLLPRYRLSWATSEVYPVVDVHVHPFPYTFEPSDADIDFLLSERADLANVEAEGTRIDCRPVHVTASRPTSASNIELLLLQETGERPLGACFADLLTSAVQNDPAYRDDNATIAGLYDRQRGMQAAMVSFAETNGCYRLVKGDVQKLGRFASTPKVLQFVSFRR